MLETFGCTFSHPSYEDIETIEQSRFQFYLTGSWYFGMGLEDISDLDLVVEYSSTTARWLEEQGYVLLHDSRNPYLEDQCVKAVYRKTNPTNRIQWIDIQLSTDITKKLLVQECLKKAQVFTMGGVRKSQARYIWQAMYMLYDQLESSYLAAKVFLTVEYGCSIQERRIMDIGKKVKTTKVPDPIVAPVIVVTSPERILVPVRK